MSQFDQSNDDLNEIRNRARRLVEGLTPEQLTSRPDPAKWSIAECLAHLNLSAEIVQSKVAAAMERGRKDNLLANGPFGLGFLGKALVWWAEPPPKFRIPAPKSIAPKIEAADPAKIVDDFFRLQDEWARLLREAEGLDQKKIKVPALFPGLPALRLCAPIPWMLAHERRHLWQAENVKRELSSQPSTASRKDRSALGQSNQNG